MKRRKTFHSSLEIQKHLTHQHKSGLTVADYCDHNKIAVSTFWNWRRKFKHRSPTSSDLTFVKIPISPFSSDQPFEIIFENKILVKVPSVFNADSLRTLITALR